MLFFFLGGGGSPPTPLMFVIMFLGGTLPQDLLFEPKGLKKVKMNQNFVNGDMAAAATPPASICRCRVRHL